MKIATSIVPICLLHMLTVTLLGQVNGIDIALCGPEVDSRGNLDMDKSLFMCGMNMMNDPHQPITHVKMYVDEGIELSVLAKFEFNNLVSINELENTATVDFFFRYNWLSGNIAYFIFLCVIYCEVISYIDVTVDVNTMLTSLLLFFILLILMLVSLLCCVMMCCVINSLWWQDLRWNMTEEFWSLAPISVYYDGVELDSLVKSEPALPIWMPDLHFIDVLELDTFAQLIKVRRSKHIQYVICTYYYVLVLYMATIE